MRNQVILVGHLTRPVELRTVNDQVVGRFNIAVDRDYKSDNGDTYTDFFYCSIFGKRADILAQYTDTGSLISVSGKLQINSYVNDEGVKQYYTNIVINEFSFLSASSNKDKDKDKNPIDSVPNSNEDDPSGSNSNLFKDDKDNQAYQNSFPSFNQTFPEEPEYFDM
ncbi:MULTISPECIES: single-stranded DNA-binding protein [Aerococcus]|uniref:single-stranded DNA-binding protein n=1 Tax=Aerococcus TaxID=1375 RepID=UPI000C9C30BB|nr:MULTISPECIES: single-stranded DNA-binding protein [Aerococcus]MDL5182253.1 single-stranded DNA-binding protein [Aerococcus loyolae]RAV69971.1 single-stranded DNA-binding protein [Aerococcus urinae]